MNRMDFFIGKMKVFFIKTRFYRHLLAIRSFLYFYLIRLSWPSKPVKTVYCISPYKTGTTYFSGLFDCDSEHEPLMHTTITHLDNPSFLRKRASWLNLDLECSGFFADKLSLVRQFSFESKVVFLSRHPESWIGSVVNYFSNLDDEVSYNYVARLVFDPICKYPVERFYLLTNAQKRIVVQRLLEYWIEVYSSAMKDGRALVIPLDELDSRKREVEQFTGLKMRASEGVWKRENKNKKGFSLSAYVDLVNYQSRVRALGYEL